MAGPPEADLKRRSTSTTTPKLSPQELSQLQPTPLQIQALAEWYTNFEAIGTGKEGHVFKCRQLLDNDKIFAVKIIPISEEDQENGVPYNIIREVSVLRELEHVNIVRLEDVISTDYEVFLVFECLDNTLQAFLKNPVIHMYPTMIRDFLHQILSGVAYIHSCKILHRDLKPDNILVHFRTRVLKIADFGAARTFEVPLESYSQNVGSASYRAPELLFGSTNYSTSNDVWSVGCIFGEMVLHRPLFCAGSDWERLDEIFTLLGTPTEETWPGVTSLCGGNIDALGPPKQQKDMGYEFPVLDEAGIDLLLKLLCLCPNYRISAEDAVKHPYFRGI